MTQKLLSSSKPYMWVLTVVAAVFGVVALGLGIAWIQATVPVRQAKALEERLDKVSTALALEHVKLTTDFAAAVDMAAELKQVDAEIQAIRLDAAKMGAAKVLLPGVRELVDALSARADALDAYNDILLSSSEYTLKRAKTFTEIANALDQLSGLSQKGVTVADGEKIVKDARADFEAAFVRMQSQDPTSPVLYSNYYVTPQLEKISTSLEGIEKAITARKVDRIGNSLEDYMAAVATDWVSSMKLQDPQGRQAANTAARAADALSQAPAQRAKALSTFGDTLLASALGAALLAGLTGFGARRSWLAIQA